MSFQIDQIIVRVIRLPLIEPFKMSLGTVQHRDQILVELRGSGVSGWGEAAVLPFPYFNHETPTTVLHVLRDFVIPMFFRFKPKNPEETNGIFQRIKGHCFARAAVEMAYWDWTGKAKGTPLYKMLGGNKSEIPVGISIPLFDRVETLLEKIVGFLEQGYHKIKIKITPGQDRELVERIVDRFGKIPLMVDANSAYTLADADLFRDLDRFELMMIEQPLQSDDILDHAKLQKQIRNPICLDESVEHLSDVKTAIELGSCKIINLKPGRVGGLSETIAIHDYAAAQGVGVWCGGMLETGVGRAINMSIATLPNFRYPGDIGESARYYHEDIVDPEIKLSTNGTLKLLEQPGIGYKVDPEKLKRFVRHEETFHA